MTTQLFKLSTKFVIIFITLVSVMSARASSAVHPKTETFSEVVAGEPMIIESESFLNWRAACRVFVQSRPENGVITDVECGEMKCYKTDYQFVCASLGSKTLEYKEKD
jgi:hypothetical protein